MYEHPIDASKRIGGGTASLVRIERDGDDDAVATIAAEMDTTLTSRWLSTTTSALKRRHEHY